MTTTPKDIPIAEARRRFEQLECGDFIYRIDVGKKKQGSRAGTQSASGYCMLSIDGIQYQAHRIAWAMHYSEQPPEVIDHINGNRLDNRIENLRQATTSLNAANCGRRAHNTSGFKGVSKCKQTGLWAAGITVRGKRTNLGRYSTPEEAHAVWLSAATEAHGEFARAQ